MKNIAPFALMALFLMAACKETPASNSEGGTKADSIEATASLDTLEFPADEIQMNPENVTVVASDDGNLKFYTWNPNPNAFYGYSTYVQVRGKDGKGKEGCLPFDFTDGPAVTKVHTLRKNDGSTYYLLEVSFREGAYGESRLVAVRIEDDTLVPASIYDGGEVREDEEETSVEYNIPDWYFSTLGEGWDWLFEYDKATKTLYVPKYVSVELGEDEYVYSGIADRYDEYCFNGEKLVPVRKDQPNRRLHESLWRYAYLGGTYRTSDFIIRIDGMEDGTFRYASWKKGNPMSSKPEVVIYGGKETGDYSFTFTNDGYEYVVNEEIPSATDSYRHCYLLVKKDGKVLLKQEVSQEG